MTKRCPLPPPDVAVSAANTIAKLSESEKLSRADAASWSVRISERYHCTLSRDLADWFDREIWKRVSGNEFCEPVPADELLVEAPEVIWPGLMPCDLLPILGNASGDWLCLRVDAQDHASEVVHWYHGGGDWLPWGRSISEAILFDTLSGRLPSPARRHAVPAADARRRVPIADDELLGWARGQIHPEISALIERPGEPEDLAEALLRHDVAEIAVRCELVQSALKETLSATLDPATAEQLGVDWNQVVQWMFDTQKMPLATRQRLQRDYGLSISKPQDWEAAERHSRQVVSRAPELAWAWDVIGYAAERRGDSEIAIDAYRRAAGCSVFTDQSVRLRTHWTAEDAAKFSASRLQECYADVVQQSEYLQLLCGSDPQDRRQRLSAHWIALADASAAAGDWATAQQRYHAAGWDLGAEPLAIYGDLLVQIATAAEKAGQRARAELARTHRRCLQDRYNF